MTPEERAGELLQENGVTYNSKCARAVADAIRAARAEALEEAATIADSYKGGKSTIGPLHGMGVNHAAEAIAASIRKRKDQ